MQEIKQILFPVDLSEKAPGLAPWVRTMAHKLGAKVHVLFVARIFEHYAGMGVPFSYINDLEGSLMEEARLKLDEFVQTNLPGVNVEVKVIQGHPSDLIVEYADENDIQLIIMGTHGRRGLEKILFGSVAEHVVKYAAVPVMTVNTQRLAQSRE